MSGHFGKVEVILKITANFEPIILKTKAIFETAAIFKGQFETFRTDTIGYFGQTIYVNGYFENIAGIIFVGFEIIVGDF